MIYPWLVQAYACGLDEQPRADEVISEFIDWYFDLPHTKASIAEVDTILGDLDVTRLAPVWLVVFLRITFSMSPVMPNWEKFLLAARDEFLNRGWTSEAVHHELVGLLDESLNVEKWDDPPEVDFANYV